ncbi:ABC transporter substrate-binding protein [Nocardioides sp. 1609]|uniref:ABC transporter substrate-binding protein n=1 Tax=Nocardioides sp. 1609 TaxID=2508327 RepID=UPI00106FFEDB|nr:ABC transporter substrate-binding protein [Nocardioides sp. 1609]
MIKKTSRGISRPGLGVAATLALAMTLAACGGSGGDPGESAEQDTLATGETLTITTFGEFGYDALIEEWNAEHPDVQVEQTKVSLWDDWKNELNTNLQANAGLPDIVAIEGDFMPAIVAAPDRWVDLSDEDVEGRWLEFKQEAATAADGQMLGYPTDAGPEAFCYRADLFEEAGLPSDREEVAKLMTTWDDYYALGEQFTAASDAAWYDSSGSIAQAMLNQVPNPFEREDGTVDVENEGLQEVWATVTANAETLSTRNKQWNPDWEAAFKKDGFATIPCPGWMRSNIRDNQGKLQDGVVWDIADVFPGGGGNWGGSFLAVPKTSTHQGPAQEFLEWLTAPEQQLRVFAELGNFPSQVEALESPELQGTTDPYFNDAPVGEIYINRAEAIDVQPFQGPLYSDILGKFQAAVDRVDEGSATPDESWKTFLADVDSLQ